uniref:Ig-like domain-containing protein n=1 Tax=Anopheles maculatus TaxID=74869 RepID=A0A182SLF9_9DIPT
MFAPYTRIHGPKGKQGRPGTNGTPGTPGINAWKVKVNDTFSNELLVPPSIAGAGTLEALRPIIVHEGTHLRLRCAATGTPRPHVEWRRADGKTISNGAWEATSMAGHTLNITKINRVHMGAYQCLADNGISPPANQTFNIEVHCKFPRIPHFSPPTPCSLSRGGRMWFTILNCPAQAEEKPTYVIPSAVRTKREASVFSASFGARALLLGWCNSGVCTSDRKVDVKLFAACKRKHHRSW